MKSTITLLLLFISVTITAQDKIYVHTVTAENSEFNVTYLDHPDLNNKPNAGIVFSHVMNPNGGSDVLNNNLSSLTYSGSEFKWAIFNEGNVNMIIGSSYNIYITEDANVIDHVSNGANAGSFGADTSVIDDSNLNGQNPGPKAIINRYWDPNAVNNLHNYGFYYDNGFGRRGIYTLDGADIPDGAGFRVMVANNGTASYSHISIPGNSNENFTVLDHPDLNGNPNASFVFTHYWGVNGVQSEVTQNSVFAAKYTGSFWAIAIEDGFTGIFDGLAFDIVIAPQEILGINDNELNTSLTLAPNPSTDYITINTTLNITKVSIYNVLGQQLKMIAGNENTSVQINISELAQGNYFAKVEAEGSVETIQFIKK